MLVEFKGNSIVLPDFLLAGSARSGTTSLWSYLREHPEVFMPDLKEPHFFNKVKPLILEEYTALFEPAGENQALGEATATYLYYYEESIRNIRHIYGDLYDTLKIVLILRNPIDRAWSWYMFEKRAGRWEKDFFEVVGDLNDRGTKRRYNDFILSGKYTEQLDAFRKAFSHILLILFDELVSDASGVLKRIYDFLGLEDTGLIPGNIGTVYNPSGEASGVISKSIDGFLFRRNRLKKA